jgi:trimeric autotransporter adhesin
MLSRVADRFTFLREKTDCSSNSFRVRHIPHNSLQVISMNKVFKSVWSEALGAWVAASELCRGRGKGGGKVARAVALVVGLGMAGGAFAAGPGTELSNGVSPPNTTNATDIAIGPNAAAQSTNGGKDAIAIGDTAKSTADGAIAIGGGVQNKATNSIIIGNGGGSLNPASLDSASSGSVFLAPAGGSVTSSKNSFSFNTSGITSTVNSDDAINLAGSVMNASGGVAIGKTATVSKANGVAIGLGSSVTGVNAVAIGANSSATRANTVSVGSQGNTRQITQMANGVSDTDAVNVSQIKGIADALGGGSVVDGAGLVTMPTYSVNGADQQGVEQAITH